MRKIREVLRLYFAAALSIRAISRSLGMSPSTVGEYLRRAKVAGLTWPVPEAIDDAGLERRLFPAPPSSRASRPLPVWSEVHRELRRKSVTLALLWEEYKTLHPDGLQYSWFCDQYRAWAAKLDLVMRQEHRAGEKLFVDYAGQTVPVVDRETGEERDAQVFVAVLGASSYTFAEATWTQTLPDWVGSHVRAFEFFGGCPELVIPDYVPGNIVRNNAVHDTPKVLERRLDAVEQRLEPLDRIRLGEVRVRERQRRHQVLDLARRPRDVDPRLAEVDLQGRASSHATVHEGLLRRDTPAQRRHVAPHRARGDRAGQRQQQPADPLRGQLPVLAQPLLDPVPPRVQAAGPRRRHPRRWRRPVYGPAHGLDVQLQTPRNLLLRYPLHQMQVADLGPLTHPDHLRVLLAMSTRRPVSSHRFIAAGTPFLECSGVPFQVATGSLFILPLPATRHRWPPTGNG